MRHKIKKCSIFVLAGIFIYSALICCCFTSIVEAEQIEPPCHQAAQDTESSKNSAECDCDQSNAMIIAPSSLKDTQSRVVYIPSDQLSYEYFYLTAKVVAYQAPPLVYDPSPLYIKHSVLRI